MAKNPTLWVVWQKALKRAALKISASIILPYLLPAHLAHWANVIDQLINTNLAPSPDVQSIRN